MKTGSRIQRSVVHGSCDLFLVLQMITRTKKLFVGGLSTCSTVDDVRGYFEQFGKVGRHCLPTSIGNLKAIVIQIFCLLLFRTTSCMPLDSGELALAPMPL